MKEIMTYKSGKFRFCSKYDEKTISNYLIEAKVLNETIVDLPILPVLAARLNPEIMYSSIAGTASIEGNPIPEEDVRKIAEGKELPIYTRKHKQEIKNLIAAYNILSSIRPTPEPLVLEEEMIKKIHQVITADISENENIPGMYRNSEVKIGDKEHGGIYTPPKILVDIKKLMSEFITWINSDEIIGLGPFIRAALAHYHFCLIHPFADGNGRTARMLEATILQAANIKYLPKELSNFYYRNVDDYYIAFSKTIKQKKEVTPFIQFMLTASLESLKRIKDSIIFYIRVFTLKDFYVFQKKKKSITNRQFELLTLLLNKNIPFTAGDLFDKSPFNLLYRNVSMQTARRDLKKLAELGLLLKKEKTGEHLVNLRVLDQEIEIEHSQGEFY